MMMDMNMMFGRNQRTINVPVSAPSTNTQFMQLKYNKLNAPAAPSTPIKMLNENEITVKTMKWGEPTWFFLHTMAEKINEEKFLEVRKNLLEIVYSICTNLPCPDCSNHAKTYLDKINFNTIQTKDDFRNMLFIFHNSVNARKGFALFSYDDLLSKYSSANMVNIVNYFLNFYLKKNSAPQMIANDMFRRRIITTVKDWLTNNMNVFNI